MSRNKIKWGILGLGKIAQKFAEDLALVEDAELVAVASSNLERAEAFAELNQASRFYGNYEALFKDEKVEVIYIASYHQMHAGHSIEAMGYKKHILCEKPIAINSKELETMIEAAQSNKVFFMEAFWSRFNPTITKVKQLIDDGEIGKLRYINVDFAFYALDWDVKSRLLNTDLGGGTLLDIGLYPIFLSYLLLGMPREILSRSKFFHTGAEMQTAMIFDYEEAQALLYSGFTSTTEMKAKISGEKGEIHLDPRWHETQGYSLIKGGVKTEVSLPTLGLGYTHEIMETNKCIREGQLESNLWSHQNSRDITVLLDRIREKNGIKFPFET